jgi:hypothetical protein
MHYDVTWRSLLRPESGNTPPPGETGWSHESLCAELARLAYYRYERGEKDRLDAALNALGFEPARVFSDRRSGTQAFATRDGNGTAWIAWRGTHVSSVIDVLVDLAAWRVDWLGEARVHAGFRWAYRRIATQIDGWLAEQTHNRLVTTGHSLGAALATMLAAARPEAELMTFGSPRPGNAAFADLFAGRSAHRFAAGCDSVAGVPWEWLGYRHVGQERYIDSTGQVLPAVPDRLTRQVDQTAARRTAWSSTRFFKGELPLRTMTDHAPINYVTALLGIRDD